MGLKLNKAGLVDPPVYHCNKGEGYCMLRTIVTDKFECVFDPGLCHYRKPKAAPRDEKLESKAKAEAEQNSKEHLDERSEVEAQWSELGR